MATAWWRLEMAAPAELEESLLWKLQSLGISRVALRHRPGAPQECQLLAWLPQSDWSESQLQALALALQPLAEPFGIPMPPLSWQRQNDEDWSLSWKQHWQADPVGQRLLILPAWLDCPAEHRGRLVIRLDPGCAFGTGSHPTTRLCLEALEELATRPADPQPEDREPGSLVCGGLGPGGLAGRRVADLGCGSGLLALAALRLGAASAVASDIDPLAVRASCANADLNGLPLPVAAGSVQAIETLLGGERADLLLCNILAPVIEALAPGFERILAADGLGLLSGLLVDQAPQLGQSLVDCGWRWQLLARQDPWGLIAIRRAAPGL
ncbi:MAG: 50S ribosomal protein L11 methyltransferase [Synechococcus sp.]|nr:50S ribosomal protein L11 methyltransferase [Synechococcus sp.]